MSNTDTNQASERREMMTKQSAPEKALAVLKKNLNVWELKELAVLLECEVEQQSQEMMKESTDD